jgi:hypothetical protein
MDTGYSWQTTALRYLARCFKGKMNTGRGADKVSKRTAIGTVTVGDRFDVEECSARGDTDGLSLSPVSDGHRQS